jgi:asparagine synthase (glutamine-hydrolysing)
MCGIAGVLHRDGRPASAAIIEKMTDLLAHRGPDGEGYFCNGPIALGHRRLSIIDLTEASRQPMASKDGRFVITYNGEIYNFRELRAELSARGHPFKSTGDTEVLLAAISEWGVDAIQRLNGMFAFGVWDGRERTLTIVRDRFGVKPVYYAQVDGALLFASEIKAFRAYPAFRTRMDVEGLTEYLSFQNFFTDRTLFDGVRLLPAGCYLQVPLDTDGPLKVHRYWDFHFQEPDGPFDEAAAIEELDFLFGQAVSRQLVSDVDVCSYLSGGIDSGSITAIASKQSPLMRTFTVGFDLSSASGVELGYDERSKAEYMSYLVKTEHYEMVLKAGDMERCLPQLAWHLEEPRVGQCYPNFYAAKLASKFNKVVLSGTGGDELFAGYPWRYYRAVVNDDFENYISKYFAFWQRLVPPTSRSTNCMPAGMAASPSRSWPWASLLSLISVRKTASSYPKPCGTQCRLCVSLPIPSRKTSRGYSTSAPTGRRLDRSHVNTCWTGTTLSWWRPPSTEYIEIHRRHLSLVRHQGPSAVCAGLPGFFTLTDWQTRPSA